MKDDQGPPTVRRISELSGLAVPAVSRALHDAPDISQDTRDLVQDIARQIGYILPGRRRSKPPKSGVISLVMSSNHDLLHTRALLISAMSLALRATPYHFVVTPYVDGDDPLTPVRHLVETASVDAIILNQTEYRDTRIRYLMERGFPFATHGRSMWSKRHAYFDFDNEAFAHRC
ncbi:MAG: LacI family DNA-binding transcriptional regulator, partial [Pseudomonadota bacterium]